MNVRTRWWQALSMLTLAGCVVLVLLELVARAYSWQVGKGFWSRPHSFESAFFATYDWPPPLIDGDLGTFRAWQTVPKAKRPDELRVLCLGGSTTVNGRNAEDLTYSRELQETLRPRFGDRELFVLNASADAFSTAHTLTNFSLRLLDFEPDVITVLHNINDLTARNFGDELLPDYSNKYLDDAFLAYQHRGGVGGAILRFSRGAQMLKWRLTVLRHSLERSSRGSRVGNPDQGLRIFERNLRSLVAVARGHGTRPILMTQAHRRPEDEAEGGEFVRYNNVTRRLGSELGAPVVDLAAALSGRGELFLDNVHLTGEGVRAVARELAEPVARELSNITAHRENPTPPVPPTESPAMTLTARWQALLKRSGLSDPNLEVLRSLTALYREGHRKYHNLNHIADCLQQLDPAAGVELPPDADLDAVRFAVFFHDAIYSTIQGGNEQKSADLARERLVSMGADTELANDVHRLIMATTHDAEPQDLEEALMIDVDLSILGRERPVFEVYEHAIREEYRLVPGPLYRSKRKEILQRFLERPSIYHTPAFQERYDAAARENLAWAISRL